MYYGKKKLEFSYKPEEGPKESYAYNLRIILRNPYVEFAQSVFSCDIDNYTVPNRDYSYEGLCALINNENWKFLDGIAVKLENFKLVPKHVRVTPWYANYEYEFEKDLLRVEYELLETGLKVSFATTKKLPKISIAPLVDIRYMHEKSDFASHKLKINNNSLVITKDSKTCYIAGNLKFENIDIKQQEWIYKLGSGFRKKINNIVFQDEKRVIMRIEGITLIPKTEKSAELFVLCNTKKVKYSKQMELIRLNFLRKYFKFFGSRYGEFYELALLARAYCLLNNFGMFVNNLCLPDAGFGWFRELWLRDCFEGLYNNFNIYYNYNYKYIEKVLELAFRYQESKTGLIPTLIKGKAVYNSLDTSFLCFLTAFKYLDYCKELKTKGIILSHASKLAQNIGKAYKLSDEGLLLTPCDISWTDSKVGTVPTRLPEHWAIDEHYYLVEINALWLKFLTELEKLGNKYNFGLADRKSAFKRVFFYNDILCDIVSKDMRRNEIENSLCLVGLALLPELFSIDELERIFSRLKKSFMHRNGKLFGLVVRNVGEVYLNDEQYHKKVFWPRDLPYFIKFLLNLKKLELVEQILINVLEHQMYECAIFYTQELFSPSYTDSSIAVPVKNPAQYWSQFVEPFLWFYNAVNNRVSVRGEHAEI